MPKGLPVRGLVTTSDVAKLLGISRQRVQQLVVEKLLPPRYVFNRNSDRKIYLFDKKTVEYFLDENGRKEVKWKEPENSEYLSIPEVSDAVGCSQMWVYDTMRQGRLKPDVTIEGEGRAVCLFLKESVQQVWEKGSVKLGYRDSTLDLIEKIKTAYEAGMNDSQIAKFLDIKQPYVARLRKEIGLPPQAKRGRPRRNTKQYKIKTQLKLNKPDLWSNDGKKFDGNSAP